MNTWISKRGAAAGAILLLAACDGGAPLDLIGGLGNVTAKPNAEALETAQMAFGAMTLTPPDGYCIDGESLKPRFALLARCDRLGDDGAAGGAPIGIMTVSVTPATPARTLPTPEQTAEALTLSDVSSLKANDSSVTFRAKGAAFAPEMAEIHWRGLALIKSQILGIALYAPNGGAATTSEGRKLVSDLIAKTQEANG